MEIENVNYINSGKYLLKSVTYKFEEEKITSIIGASGSGKTLLTNILVGLIKPTIGAVNMGNSIGYVSQDFTNMFFNETVYDELAFGIDKNKYDKDKITFEITRVLEAVGLSSSFLNKDPLKLSKGEQARLAMAISLISEPKVLVLDEPTSYLDSKGTEDLIKLLKKLKRDYHSTIIITSNDIEFVYSCTDNVVLLNHGKLVISGKKKDIYNKYKILEENEMEIPKILEFISYVEQKKRIKLNPTSDIKELMKDIYRNV